MASDDSDIDDKPLISKDTTEIITAPYDRLSYILPSHNLPSHILPSHILPSHILPR